MEDWNSLDIFCLKTNQKVINTISNAPQLVEIINGITHLPTVIVKVAQMEDYIKNICKDKSVYLGKGKIPTNIHRLVVNKVENPEKADICILTTHCFATGKTIETRKASEGAKKIILLVPNPSEYIPIQNNNQIVIIMLNNVLAPNEVAFSGMIDVNDTKNNPLAATALSVLLSRKDLLIKQAFAARQLNEAFVREGFISQLQYKTRFVSIKFKNEVTAKKLCPNAISFTEEDGTTYLQFWPTINHTTNKIQNLVNTFKELILV